MQLLRNYTNIDFLIIRRILPTISLVNCNFVDRTVTEATYTYITIDINININFDLTFRTNLSEIFYDY